MYTANHGGDSIAFLQESNFWKDQAKTGKHLSLVLMDTEMPIMDGLTCVRKIQELQREGSIIGHVPIISATANARSEQIEVATAAGMVSCRPRSSSTFFLRLMSEQGRRRFQALPRRGSHPQDAVPGTTL